MNSIPSELEFTRRKFLCASSLSAGGMALPPILHAQNKQDRFRLGLAGCGGRGKSAANDALSVNPNVQLFAAGDVFGEKVKTAVRGLNAKYATTPERSDVPKERQFTGLDAYKQVLASQIDCVLLGTPCGFRPLHPSAAVEAGKHILCEKPMATDAVGVRAVIEAARRAKKKQLGVTAGFCWCFDARRRGFFRKIHSGAIGEVRGLYHTCLTASVKPMPALATLKEGVTDQEWQLRNRYNFTWLSGDGFVEQSVHSVDKMFWAREDKPPRRCTATGGRNVPNPGGDTFDHIEENFEWANGALGVVSQRRISGCFNDNSDYITGASGIATSKWSLAQTTGTNLWKAKAKNLGMCIQEHKGLHDSIWNGAPRNDGEWMCRSTLAGIMGRMPASAGREVTWKHILKSRKNLFPRNLKWDMELPIAPMASPRRTKLI